LLEKIPELYIFHITGSQQSEEIALAYGSLRDNLRRRIWSWPFVKNLDELTAVADVVVSRSGATSLAELGAQRKAVILVPNPYLTGGHQTYNARLVAEQNAALVVTEKQIHDDITILEETIALLLMSKKQQDTLGDNLSKMIVPNAAANIAKILSEVAA
jgi:UDP-N-acetylglucosamine--N-acetylmuramyl-(pentapeptide) pyrophosphoryl-undecaprenol N-acetylglucosamine transferase